MNPLLFILGVLVLAAALTAGHAWCVAWLCSRDETANDETQREWDA